RHVRGAHLVRARFRNVPILAEETAHIAARCAHGKYARARKKMVQRLLLDGINLHRRRMRIAQTVKLPALVRAYVAEPRLPLANMAMPRTQVAMDVAARLRLPPARLVQFRRFLQYFQ